MQRKIAGCVSLCLVFAATATQAQQGPEQHWVQQTTALSQSVSLDALPRIEEIKPLEAWMDAYQVLADLRWLTNDPGLHPVVRAHLQQHLAVHLMHHHDPAGADEHITQAGFLTRWSTQENPTKQSTWTDLSGMDHAGYVHLDPTQSGTLYLRTRLHADAAQETLLMLGVEGHYQAWLNGHAIAKQDTNTGAHIDRHAWKMRLTPGDNDLILKITTTPHHDNGLYARLVDHAYRPLVLQQTPGQGPPPTFTNRKTKPGLDPVHKLLDAQNKQWNKFNKPTNAPVELIQDTLRTCTMAKRYGLPKEQWAPLAARALNSANASLRQTEETSSETLKPHGSTLLHAYQLGIKAWSPQRIADMGLQASPKDPWVQWTYAATLLQSPNAIDLPKALQILHTLEQRPQAFWPATVLRARLDTSMGLPHSAQGKMKHLAQKHPFVPAIWTQAAQNQQHTHAPQDELTTRLHSLRFRATNGQARGRAIALLRQTGRFHQALELVNEGLRLAPEAQGLSKLKADILIDLDETEEATSHLKILHQQHPTDLSVLRTLAALARRQNDLTSWQHYQQAAFALQPAAEQQARRDHTRHKPNQPELALLLPSNDPRLVSTLAWNVAPQAPVVILAQQQLVRLHPDGSTTTHHQKVLVAKNKRGAKIIAKHRIAYKEKTESIQDIKVRHQRQGQRLSTSPTRSDFHPQQGQEDMVRDLSLTTLTIPGVQSGDLIELRWTVERKASPDQPPFAEMHYLQGSWPVRFARFALYTPENTPMEASWHPHQTTGMLVRKRTAPGQPLVLEAQNIPALHPEEDRPGRVDISAHLHVSAVKDWDELASWYNNFVAPQLVTDEALRTQVDQIIEGATTDAQKAKRIHNWVARQTRYLALELGIHSYLPYPVTQTLQRGFGDCKDQASLLKVMLEHAGLPTNLVLVRTQRLGTHMPKTASLRAFDHVIAYIPSLDLFIDATSPHLGGGLMPVKLQDAPALILSDQGGTLRRLPAGQASDNTLHRNLELDLRRPDKIKIQGKLRASGQFAAAWRHALPKDQNQTRALHSALLPEIGPITLQEHETVGMEELSSDIKIRWSGQTSGLFHKQGHKQWVLPLVKRVNLVDGWAASPTRRHDKTLDYPFSQHHATTWRLSKGWKLAHGQARVTKGQSDFGAWRVEQVLRGDTLEVTTHWTLTKRYISAQEYSAFRAFLINMERGLNAPLWLEAP